jgi:hypothetical protein
MQQPNKAVISPGLRGLMLVQQGLKELQGQGGAPAAGGLPTVLDQAKQAGAQALGAQAPQQQVQPSMTPPPQGPQAPEGGITDIAQNAATGIDINQMKQKQAEQAMMQMAQQQQQQPTQMMASGGIAGLPAENMRGFAEGGVLGYAGDEEQGSEVKSKSLLDRFPEGALIHNIAKYLSRSNDMVGDYDAEQRIPGRLIRSIPEIPQMPLPERAIVEGEQSTPPAARAAARPERMVARPERMAGKAQPSVDLSGVKYGANMDGGIGGILPTAPATAESPEVAAILANEARKQALIKARPDYYAQNIAALDADKQARAEAAAEQQKRRGFDAFMALVGSEGGIGGMGRASTQFDKVQSERKDAARQATLLDAQMRVKLGELEHARQIGDIDGQNNVTKEIAGIKRQMDQIAAQREGYGVQSRGQDIVAGTATADREARAVENAARNQSQERIAAMQRETTGNKENLALFKAQSKNLDDAFKRAIAKRSFAPAKAKEEYTALVKEWDALAAQYGLDKKTAPPPPFEGGADAPAAAAAAPPGYKVVGPAPQK